MDAESLLLSLELASGSGQGLSPDRRASLLTSLLLVKRDYRYDRVLFWGRILGLVADYYIAQGLSEDQLAPRKTLYSLNCTEWSLLPPATEEMVAQSSVVKGRFMGDPSYEYEHIELQKVNEGEKVFEEEVVIQIKEETRLVYVIDQIDKAVAIIPRGALFKTPFGPTHVNRTFEGLSLSEAKKLSSYFHFREPVELKNKTLLEKADLDPSLDFMDSLEHDVPKDEETEAQRLKPKDAMEFRSCYPGWSAMAQSRLTATSTSWVQGPGVSRWRGATPWWYCAACSGQASPSIMLPAPGTMATSMWALVRRTWTCPSCYRRGQPGFLKSLNMIFLSFSELGLVVLSYLLISIIVWFQVLTGPLSQGTHL
ncbi:radial spoke head protein 9 homolog isoform X2 [Callithrix jacchus]|uniref:radial spoke head protein 9 homolog isoform X2 n=1 Tax=Callithrix jacchus TaxID=9483 RepID=UPI00159D5394|nr:radial spoke head protein 9 homolog isoform X2 [Callithrix jacchus]